MYRGERDGGGGEARVSTMYIGERREGQPYFLSIFYVMFST